MLGVMRAPDVAGPGEVLIAGTPPDASLVAKLEKGESQNGKGQEPGPEVADSRDEAWLWRHVEVSVICLFRAEQAVSCSLTLIHAEPTKLPI